MIDVVCVSPKPVPLLKPKKVLSVAAPVVSNHSKDPVSVLDAPYSETTTNELDKHSCICIDASSCVLHTSTKKLSANALPFTPRCLHQTSVPSNAPPPSSLIANQSQPSVVA